MDKPSYLSVNTYLVDGTYRVYWSTDDQFGVVKVITGEATTRKYNAVIAEITGLHYLLTQLQVAGRDRTGVGLAIELSRGTIRKGFNGRRKTSNEFRSHLHWLRTQFADAALSVPKRNKAEKTAITDAVMNGESFEGRRMLISESVEFTSAPLTVPIKSPDIGRVVISEHAVQQFQKRNDLESAGKAWRKIRNMVANERLRPSNIGSDVMQQKQQKWADKSARFFDCARSWQLVLVPEAGQLGEDYWTLATLYQRHDISAY